MKGTSKQKTKTRISQRRTRLWHFKIKPFECTVEYNDVRAIWSQSPALAPHRKRGKKHLSGKHLQALPLALAGPSESIHLQQLEQPPILNVWPVSFRPELHHSPEC